MKLAQPENPNYVAEIVEIKTLVELTNSDYLVGTPLVGFQAIVSKDTEVGTIGVVFTAETQLSEEYTKENNLYRHSELNKDKTKAGYIEDNRRVKAMKFRGNVSNALFMPLDSLKWTGAKLEELKVGDRFDQLNNKPICKKYEKKVRVSRTEKNKVKVFKRVDEAFLPMHYDTEQYFRNKDNIAPNQEVVVTQKLHGTSIRIGNTVVKRKLGLVEKMLKRLGANIALTEFDTVFGSKRVIKDPKNPNQQHYYESAEGDDDLWTDVGKRYADMVPQNFVVYGEVIGWTKEGSPIQQNYTYNLPHGTNELYVYRVAVVTNQGLLVDLAWDLVKEFCRDRGLKTVPELWRGKHGEFNAEEWIDTDYHTRLHGGYPQAIPLAKESPVDEGIVVRVDRLATYALKVKGPQFYEFESKMLDSDEAVDMEEEGKVE